MADENNSRPVNTIIRRINYIYTFITLLLIDTYHIIVVPTNNHLYCIIIVILFHMKKKNSYIISFSLILYIYFKHIHVRKII